MPTLIAGPAQCVVEVADEEISANQPNYEV
jgi:hypothetical protein